MLEIRKNDFQSFFEVPFKIYVDTNYVSIFKDDLKRFLSMKNPLFRSEQDFSYFTAYKDGVPAGRILAHIHHASNELYHWNRAYFGYFDCINDISVAQALLAQAEDFARARGCNELIGNFNLTAMQMIGVVTKIHRPYHYSEQIYHPEYISKLLEKCGYESSFPVITHEFDLAKLDANTLLGEKQNSILKDPRFQFEKLGRGNFKEIMEAMRLCLNDGFKDNPMFVPQTADEIYFQAKDLMLVVDKRISVLAKFEGHPVGVIVCIPNLNPFLAKTKSRFGLLTLFQFLWHKWTCRSAIIIFYSVFREFHSQGLNGAMLWEVITSLQKAGYEKMAGTWISLANKASLRQIEKMNGEVMHELCLYKKKID